MQPNDEVSMRFVNALLGQGAWLMSKVQRDFPGDQELGSLFAGLTQERMQQALSALTKERVALLFTLLATVGASFLAESSNKAKGFYLGLCVGVLSILLSLEGEQHNSVPSEEDIDNWMKKILGQEGE